MRADRASEGRRDTRSAGSVARGGVAAANRLSAGMERAGFSPAPGIPQLPRGKQSRRGRHTGNLVLFLERIVIIPRDDYVVENGDPKQVPHIPKPFGHGAIFSTWGDVCGGRVVLCNDYGNRAGKNRGLEHFASRHGAACSRSGCRNVKAYNLMLSIKKERSEEH